MKEKIAEIVCPKCKYMESNGECSSYPSICTIIQAILALISEREKAMIEALKASVKAIACPHETLAGCESCCNTLAEIDAALKGVTSHE